jgi:hypothetical protein
MAPRLWTARYANPTLAEHVGAKVQASLGAPKFRLPYELHQLLELAPAGWMLNMPEAAYAIAYARLLETRGGATMMRSRFAEVARTAGVDQLVLCCFEDVRKPGVWCHRRILAAWLEQQTGEPVNELDDGAEQASLFPA